METKDIQSGQMLCKSFSPNPFWVLFGKVETPKFLLNEENRIHRDKRGYGFLLIPTMKIETEKCFGNLDSNEFVEQCWRMGLREHPNFFLATIYKLVLKSESANTLNKIAEEFKELYTEDEILIRLWSTHLALESNISHRWHLDRKICRFECSDKDDVNILSKIQVLNILLTALNINKESDFFKLLSKGCELNKKFMGR